MDARGSLTRFCKYKIMNAIPKALVAWLVDCAQALSPNSNQKWYMDSKVTNKVDKVWIQMNYNIKLKPPFTFYKCRINLFYSIKLQFYYLNGFLKIEDIFIILPQSMKIEEVTPKDIIETLC